MRKLYQLGRRSRLTLPLALPQRHQHGLFPEAGLDKGERSARYALIIENGKIVYAEKEPGGEITVSGADAILAKL
jgi:hypothetical protein